MPYWRGKLLTPAARSVRSRWVRRLAVAAATLAVAVLCAIGVAPLLVDTDSVKRAVEQQFTQSAGGEVAYESASLDLFPRPRVSFSGITVRVAGTVKGRIAALHVRVAWLPLLYGEVHPTAVRIERPVLEARIASGAAADPFTVYRAALGPIVDALARYAASTSLAIERGEVAVAYGERRIVTLSELEVAAEISAEAITATASAATELWRAARAEVSIAPGSLAASAKVQVSGLQLARSIAVQPVDEALGVRVDTADLELEVVSDGRSCARGSITGSAPRVEIARAGRSVELGAVSIALDASRDSDALVFGLREFRAGDLIPGATGTLRAKADGTTPVLELRVPALDLERAGAAALALAGDLDAVRDSVEGLRRGTLRELTLHAAAGDFARLAAPSSLRAEARMDAATVAVSAAGIVVKNGSGRFLIAEGVLQGSELAGDIGRSSFNSGALAVAFLTGASLRSLRGTFTADLADALTITRRLLPRAQRDALAGIVALQGRASATIDYEAGRRGAPLVVDLKGMQATGRYRGVPVPLTVSRGDLRYAGNAVSVSGLAGSAGGSSLSKGTIDIAFGQEPLVRAASGDATLVLDEIYPLIASLEGLRSMVQNISGAAGTAAVRLTRLSGPLSRPAALDFDIAIEPAQVRLASAALPGPLTLAAGSVRVTPRALRMDGLQAALLDAQVTASGTAATSAGSGWRVNLALTQGSSGAEAIAWAGKRWKLPPEGLPRAPLTLSAGRVELIEGAVELQGTASIAASVQAEFDLAWRPGRFDLRRLALNDADSDAVLRLQGSSGAAELAFSGRLHHRTLERSLAQPPQTRVMLEGDFRASIDLAELHRSSADGTLKIEGLDLREHAGLPVTIDRMNVGVTGRTLHVHDGVLRLAGERLAVSGTVEGGGERLAVDARISADTLDVAQLLRALPRDRPGKTLPRGAWNLPADGRVAIAVSSMAYGGYVLRSMAATVSLAPNRVVVDATDVRLCGIAMPFTATLVPGSITVSARLAARNQALAEAVPCLAGDQLAATGTYDLDAEFSASGSADVLLRAARGSFRVAARAGRIYRAAALSRTLAVDEVTSLTHASAAAMMADGFEYREIAAAGTLEARRVRLDHGILDSPLLGITLSGEVGVDDRSLAVQGLVAPFDTIHRVVRGVPIAGRALGTPLVVVPVNIGGSLNDPQVEVLAAAAVGATLINLMSTAFLAPVHLFDPAARRPQGEP